MNTGAEDIKEWEQQPGEKAKRYAAAKVYFAIGPDRSLPEVARRVGKSHDLMKRWSAEDHWKDRSAARDRWVAKIEEEAREKQRRAKAALRAQRADQSEEEDYALAQKMRQKANRMLDFPLSEATTTDPQGKTVIIKPARWNIGMVPRLAESASKLSPKAPIERPRDADAEVLHEWNDTDLTAADSQSQNDDSGAGGNGQQ